MFVKLANRKFPHYLMRLKMNLSNYSTYIIIFNELFLSMEVIMQVLDKTK